MLFLPLPSQRPVHLRLSSFGGEIAPTAVVICSSPRVWSVCVFFFLHRNRNIFVCWLVAVRRHPDHPPVFAKDGRTPSCAMAQQVPIPPSSR